MAENRSPTVLPKEGGRSSANDLNSSLNSRTRDIFEKLCSVSTHFDAKEGATNLKSSSDTRGAKPLSVSLNETTRTTSRTPRRLLNRSISRVESMWEKARSSITSISVPYWRREAENNTNSEGKEVSKPKRNSVDSLDEVIKEKRRKRDADVAEEEPAREALTPLRRSNSATAKKGVNTLLAKLVDVQEVAVHARSRVALEPLALNSSLFVNKATPAPVFRNAVFSFSPPVVRGPGEMRFFLSEPIVRGPKGSEPEHFDPEPAVPTTSAVDVESMWSCDSCSIANYSTVEKCDACGVLKHHAFEDCSSGGAGKPSTASPTSVQKKKIFLFSTAAFEDFPDQFESPPVLPPIQIRQLAPPLAKLFRTAGSQVDSRT